MLTAAHWLIELGCLAVIFGGVIVVVLGFGTIGEARLMLDREHVQRAYEAGGWDYPRTDTPIYDATLAAQIDLALWELARDLDAFEDGQR